MSDDGLVHQFLLREQLARGNKIRFRATGMSMSPLIRSGDILHIIPIDRINAGDILLYERENDWFAHRLIQQQRNDAGQLTLILRGDNLEQADPATLAESLLGRIVGVERGTRLISLDSWRIRAYGFLIRRSFWRRFLYYFAFPTARRLRWLMRLLKN